MTRKTAAASTPLFLDGTQARTRWRGFRFHRTVKLVLAGLVRARPDPVSRQLTFRAKDLERHVSD